jgi:heme/copper-type cytochrome/quinol oxidase subunit 2
MSSSLARKRERAHKHAHEKQTKQFVRFGAFTAILSTVVVAVVYFLAPVFAPKESGITESANAKVVNIQAAMDGFDMQEIHVKVGETVKVNLRSLDNEHHTDGGGKHQFAIDELDVNIVTMPLSVNSGTFVASKAGTFTFYCDICCGGKANPTMNGKLIVES